MFTVVWFPAAVILTPTIPPSMYDPSLAHPRLPAIPYAIFAVHNYSQLIFCEGFVHKYILFSIGKVWLRVK